MKIFAILLLLGVTVGLFQNCGDPMEVARDISSEEFETSNFYSAGVRGKTPNILMIMLDDAGQGDWMDPRLAPNIAKFRKKATLFPSFYTSPMCAPTRISMLSGRSHVDYSMLWVCGSNAIYGIPKGDATIPQSLNERGYVTATLGKWHASVKDTKKAAKVFPPAIHYGADKKFDHHVISQGVVSDGYFVKGGKNSKKEVHQSDKFGNLTKQHILKLSRQKDKKPFYVQYWLNAPHSPHTPSPRMFKNKKLRAEYERFLSFEKKGVKNALTKKWKSVHRRMLYEKLLQQGDENIGKVLDFVQNSKDPYLKNTIILITSDNGGTDKTRVSEKPYGNIDYKGRRLRGFKTDVFEGGIKQNLLVKMPGQTKPRIDNSVISVMDLFPTYLHLVGSAPTKEEAKHFDGESFHQRLLSPAKAFKRKKTLYWTFKVKNEHLKKDEDTAQFDDMSWAIRKGKWKLVREPMLYGDNPKKDPMHCGPCLFEMKDGYSDESPGNNVASDHPELVKKLREDYIEWFLSSTQINADPKKISPNVDSQKREIEGFKDGGPSEVIRDYDLGSSSSQRWVKLKKKVKFDVNRLDFTVSAKITPDKLIKENQIIAMRKGTWVFRLSPQGYLEVLTYGKNEKGKYVAKVVKSEKEFKLKPGQSYDVGFSIYSFKSRKTVVRIYGRDHGHDIDDEERLRMFARGETTYGLRSNFNTIYIGADPSTPKKSFHGLVEDFRIYHSPLRRSEIGYGMRWWGNKYD